MRLKIKFPAILLGLALASAGAMGAVAWFGATSALTQAAVDNLKNTKEGRKDLLEMTADRLVLDLDNLAAQQVVSSSIPELDKNLELNPGEYEKTKAYFQGSGDELAKKDGADAETMYGFRHAKVHASLLSAMERGGFADILILGADGRVVYTVRKGKDFTVKADDPGYAGSGLGTLLGKMQASAETQLVDFAPYPLAGGEASAFIGRAVLRKANVAMNGAQDAVRVGYVVLRINSSLFDAVLSGRKNLGQTGEIVAFGSDGKIRTTPPGGEAAVGDDISKLGISQPPAYGETGHFVRGGASFVAISSSAKVLGTSWTLIAAQSEAEAFADIDAMSRQMAVTALVTLVATLVIGLLAARGVTRPLADLTRTLRDMASGVNHADIPGHRRRDEIGEIARAVVQIQEMTARGVEDRSREAAELQAQREAERRVLTETLARDFEERVGSVVAKFAETAVAFESSATSMVALAQEANQRSNVVAEGGNAASGNVRSVAVASEELFATIREVAELINRSGQIAGEAGRRATATGSIFSSLSETANRIGSVVDIIQSIAEQTNLLALNATIEAARAGEAGRGFAVVAGEVKGLAGQTARATDEIASQIAAMRDATRSAVDSITEIRSVVDEIGSAVASVANAIDQQTAATGEIARSAQLASDGTTSVSENINEVRQTVDKTDHAAAGLAREAQRLGQDAVELRRNLNQFVEQILAA